MFLKPAYCESTYRFRMPRTGSETLCLHSGKCWECVSSLGCFRRVQNVLYNQAFCLCQPELRSELCWIRSCLSSLQQETSTFSVPVLPSVVQRFVMLSEGLQHLGSGWWDNMQLQELCTWQSEAWGKGKASDCNYRDEAMGWSHSFCVVWLLWRTFPPKAVTGEDKCRS